MTERQQQVYDFVAERCQAGKPPTIREICSHFGFTSTNAAADHLKALERQGLLQREKGRGLARGWTTTKPVGAWLAGVTMDHARAAESLARVWPSLPPATLKAISGFAERAQLKEVG